MLRGRARAPRQSALAATAAAAAALPSDPVHTEAVSNVVGRASQLLAAFLVLVALLAEIRATRAQPDADGSAPCRRPRSPLRGLLKPRRAPSLSAIALIAIVVWWVDPAAFA